MESFFVSMLLYTDYPMLSLLQDCYTMKNLPYRSESYLIFLSGAPKVSEQELLVGDTQHNAGRPIGDGHGVFMLQSWRIFAFDDELKNEEWFLSIELPSALH